MPGIVKDWKQSDDGQRTPITLRKGIKWSDGTPFTARDFVFWYGAVSLDTGGYFESRAWPGYAS